MPSETYDNVWVKAGGPTAASQFVTSDQCIGCHSAGGTGLQFDMTRARPRRTSSSTSRPTARGAARRWGWRAATRSSSPSLRARPRRSIPPSSPIVQDTCLGCHGIMRPAPVRDRRSRSDRHVRRVPAHDRRRGSVSAGTTRSRALANYGALARDGISCTACHRMVLGKDGYREVSRRSRRTRCVERAPGRAQSRGSPGSPRPSPAASCVGPPDQLFGPFQEPKHEADEECARHRRRCTTPTCRARSCAARATPCTCRSCIAAQTIGHVYEQTTYPEWAFSDYRTGTSPDGPLPLGPGPQAQSCQDCHMPSKDADGKPYRSKIAGDPGIQQLSRRPSTRCRRTTSTCRCARASASTRWSASTCSCSRWRGSSPTCSASARSDPMLHRRRHRLHSRRPRRRCSTRRRNAHRDRSPSATCAIDDDTLQRARHRHQQGRPQVSVRRRLPPRLHRVQRARRQRQGAVVVGPHQRAPASSSTRRASRSPASCGGSRTARRASSRTRASISRIIQVDHPAGPGADLSRSWSSAPPDVRRADLRRRARPGGRADHELPVDLHQGEGQPHCCRTASCRLEDRIAIAAALGAGADLAEDTEPGRRSATTRTTAPAAATRSIYRVPLADLDGAAGLAAGDALLSGDAAVSSCRTASARRTAPTPSGSIFSPASST